MARSNTVVPLPTVNSTPQMTTQPSPMKTSSLSNTRLKVIVAWQSEKNEIYNDEKKLNPVRKDSDTEIKSHISTANIATEKNFAAIHKLCTEITTMRKAIQFSNLWAEEKIQDDGKEFINEKMNSPEYKKFYEILNFVFNKLADFYVKSLKALFFKVKNTLSISVELENLKFLITHLVDDLTKVDVQFLEGKFEDNQKLLYKLVAKALKRSYVDVQEMMNEQEEDRLLLLDYNAFIDILGRIDRIFTHLTGYKLSSFYEFCNDENNQKYHRILATKEGQRSPRPQ